MTQEVIHMTNTLPDNQVSAWLKMALKKNDLSKSLQAKELSLQSLCMNVPDTLIQDAIKEYKKQFDELKSERLNFTNAIDAGIVQPLMAFEKRCDVKVYAPYILLTTRDIALRQTATTKLANDTALANECASFKSHFQNEFARLVLEYRQKLYAIVSEAYTQCLSQRIPVNNIHTAIQAAHSAIHEVKPGSPANFTRILIQPAKAKELYDAINKPDYPSYLSTASNDLQERFSLYANDLARADEAVEEVKQELQFTMVEEVKELQQETAANVLIASAEAFVMPEPGFKSVIELSKIAIEDDNPQWVLLVTTAFIKNFQQAFIKLRVKKYSALTVAQMAGALDALGVKVEGVKYNEIVK